MKKAGYTLIELLVVLSIVCVMILLVPKMKQSHFDSYQEALFFSDFENYLKVHQTNALACDQASFLHFHKPPENNIIFKVYGQKELTRTLELPPNLELLTNLDLTLKSQKGTVSKGCSVSFRSKNEKITYKIQPGIGRYSIERVRLVK